MAAAVTHAPKVLNVGSGPLGSDARFSSRFSADTGWEVVRADLDPGVAPDIIASITDLSAFADESFETVWCSHILEHLYAHEANVAARELFRVLRRGGKLHAFVPDVEAAARVAGEGRMMEPLYISAAGPITPHDILYGHGAAIAAGRTAMAHRSGFTPQKLGQVLLCAGFDPVLVRRTPEFELVAEATRPDGIGADPTAPEA
ncbi:methyltransferase domain-containing protein [Jiella sp. M17.18]|uniref:class I SAM-dependent methyltransferase n=1 Tax=Jiella sp. M17.18 TaxID=3234247 RepID=UPI0034E0457D